jgi:exonuclease VII small subunit
MKKNAQTEGVSGALQKELDDILEWFTSADVDLDIAVLKYERATQIIAELRQRIIDAKNHIEIINKDLSRAA